MCAGVGAGNFVVMHYIWESFGHAAKPDAVHDSAVRLCNADILAAITAASGCPQPGTPSLRPVFGFLRARDRWLPMLGRHVAKSLRGIKPASKLLLIPFLFINFSARSAGRGSSTPSWAPARCC